MQKIKVMKEYVSHHKCSKVIPQPLRDSIDPDSFSIITKTIFYIDRICVEFNGGHEVVIHYGDMVIDKDKYVAGCRCLPPMIQSMPWGVFLYYSMLHRNKEADIHDISSVSYYNHGWSPCTNVVWDNGRQDLWEVRGMFGEKKSWKLVASVTEDVGIF